MAGLFGKFKPGGGGPMSPAFEPANKKKGGEPLPEITPLERMLQNAGPIRADGSDKFFGMENFGNTCYCNSIVQALYYSMPFREHVASYPPHSPHDTPTGNGHKVSVRNLNGGATSPATANAKSKGVSASEALKRRATVNTVSPTAGQTPGNRPEDKPDSPEYKKKHAMLTGPILELTYEVASHDNIEETTFTSMKDMFMALIAAQSRTGVLSPQRFLEIFKRDNEMFRTSMHQDAHEFYGLVLNAIITNVEDTAKRLRELELSRDDGHSTASSSINTGLAMGHTNGTKSPGTGWVHEIFEGVLTSETKCLTCENASQRDESFLDLSIDLEQHSSVTSCLRKFSAEEMLCERNKFHCDNCGGLQEAEKRMKIKRLPKILTLHLKRFKYTEDMTRLQKLFHRVVYPYHLRMFNTTDLADDPDRLYELYAVVVHIGGNAYHGHYVSIIKTKDRGWLLFDDEMVEPVDKHYVRNFFGDKPGMACAYVLFYQETTLEAVQQEQEAEGLAEVALASQEAGIALGNSYFNGNHPGAISKQVTTPGVDEKEQMVTLGHAMTAPARATATPPKFGEQALNMNHLVPQLDKKGDGKSKADKEREKKELKELEKARKAAEKERVKAEVKRGKDFEAMRKESQKAQAEETKAVMAASKVSAAEDDEKRKRESGAAEALAVVTPDKKENQFISDLSLSRSNKGSKSINSRKPLGWLKPGEKAAEKAGEKGGETAVDGEPSSQTPEKNEKATKERFSFSLGRKKSNILSP